VRFLDTNVLLYAISRDPAEREKSEIANELLEGRDVVLSVQVLQEFYVQSTRATRSDRLTHQQAAGLVETFMRFPIQALTVGVVRAAFDTKQRFQISFWDAAIVEAARAIGSEIVLTEDLQDGQDYAGVRCQNPFA
jgi:predicted nucleic acid-binding protein